MNYDFENSYDSIMENSIPMTIVDGFIALVDGLNFL